MGVTNAECNAQNLTVSMDGIPYPEHCTIDFSNLTKSAIEKIAKILAENATRRGWLYQDDQ